MLGCCFRDVSRDPFAHADALFRLVPQSPVKPGHFFIPFHDLKIDLHAAAIAQSLFHAGHEALSDPLFAVVRGHGEGVDPPQNVGS